MAIFANLGNYMRLPSATGEPFIFDGSILSAYGNKSFQTVRRQRKDAFSDHAHLGDYIFDPQLYLADLDFDECSDICTTLASYSWFDVQVEEYESGLMKQHEWGPLVKDEVRKQWPGDPTTDEEKIKLYAKECLLFQREIGCSIIVAPAPATFSVRADYEEELSWLMAAKQAKRELQFDEPLYATVALSSPLFSQDDKAISERLSAIANAVTAREFDGIYLVFVQTGESGVSKHATDERALYHILRFISLLKRSDPVPSIIVNGMGFFGLICRAVGADAIGVGWFRKQYRIHHADYKNRETYINKNGEEVSTQRAHPRYWTNQVLGDIGLHKDFDKLVKKGMLNDIQDDTVACEDLLGIARRGKTVEHVDAWSKNNVTASREHFLRSCIKAERKLAAMSYQERLDYMSQWLEKATALERAVTTALRSGSTSYTDHVIVWRKAFERFRTSQ